MKNTKFVYDEKTSSLFAPDGSFLKKLFCPKAKNWNQLLVDQGENRWRNCQDCKEKVIDLDSVNIQILSEMMDSNRNIPCLYVSSNSNNVIFLKDRNAISSLKEISDEPIRIQTVYGKADISRGFAMGYWPDVRIIRADPKLNSRITVGQDSLTGEVDYSHDLRHSFRGKDDNEKEKNRPNFKELYPFISYYPFHKSEPIGAYLVPKGLKNGTRIFIDDPIENILGERWNQGGGGKASNIPGYIENNLVVLEVDKVKVQQWIG